MDLLRIVAAAHQRRGEHEGDAQLPPLAGVCREHVGMHIALHLRVTARRPHVLADGHDVAPDGGQIFQHAADLPVGLAQAHHQAALADVPAFPHPPQQLQALGIVRLRPDAGIVGGRGLHIVVDDMGPGSHDRAQGRLVAPEIRDQDLDGGTGSVAPADGLDGGREMRRAAVGQVVARHGGHHGMAQPQGRRGPAHAGGLVRVRLADRAVADIAEGAPAGAGIAKDEERGGLAGIAFENVRAPGAPADRVQLHVPDQRARGGIGRATGQLHAQPRGDAQ